MDLYEYDGTSSVFVYRNPHVLYTYRNVRILAYYELLDDTATDESFSSI